MYCHTPKGPSFAARNRLPHAVQVWDALISESGVDDYDTKKADVRWLDRQGVWAPWTDGACDFFSETLDGRRVSGYLEGFSRVISARKITTWTGIIPLVQEMIAAKIPGLEKLRVPQIALDLQREADEASQREARDRDELAEKSCGDGTEAEDLRQCWGTPQALFDVLHAEYCFTVDACASPFNHKLARYWTRADDAFSQDVRGERLWINPPYHDIPPWFDLAAGAEFAALLLPVRTDRVWFMRWKPLCETHYFIGEAPEKRIQFVAPPGVPQTSNPGIHALFLLGEGVTPGLEVYRSGKDGRRL